MVVFVVLSDTEPAARVIQLGFELNESKGIEHRAPSTQGQFPGLDSSNH